MDTFRRIFVSRDLSFCLEIFITQNSSDKLNWMSGSLVSASNGKGGNLGFYISDIILRGWDQVSAERGWSPHDKDSVSGWQKILSSFSGRYGSTYLYKSKNLFLRREPEEKVVSVSRAKTYSSRLLRNGACFKLYFFKT